jgi:hypothetical protein
MTRNEEPGLRRIRAAALTVLLAMAAQSIAFADECIGVDVRERRRHSDLVFSGTATSDKVFSGGRHIVELDVDAVWKGNLPRRTKLYYFIETMCAKPFEPGKRYIVFAPKWGLIDFVDPRRQKLDRPMPGGWNIAYSQQDAKKLGHSRAPR